MTDLVHYEAQGGVARITLDSPRNRNALSTQLVAELEQRIEDALVDTSVRVVVLTGAGPVFCSGADLSEQRPREDQPHGDDGDGPGSPRRMVRVLKLLWESPKPVVLHLNGPARAGGLGLVGAADIAIAPETATFGFAEVRLGVVAAVIAVTTLPRMSPRAGLELFLTGEPFDARRAAEVGLVTRTVPDEQIDGEVERYVGMLLRGAPGALADSKRVVLDVPGAAMDDAFEEMLALSVRRFASEEGQEGIQAFFEKRAPNWVVPS